MECFLQELYKKVGKETEEFIKENCYIAGGSVYSTLTGKPINDIDLYFKSREAMIEFIKLEDLEDSYVPKEYLNIKDGCLEKEQPRINDWYQYSNIKYNLENNKTLKLSFEMNLKSGFDLIYINEYAGINGTFMGFGGDGILIFPKSIIYKVNDKEYQFILRFNGQPIEMMNNTFDFKHVKIAYDLKTKQFIYCDGATESILKNTIEYVNSYYPLSSLKRLFKYQSRGMYFDSETYINILKDIKKLDLDDEMLVLDQISGYYDGEEVKHKEEIRQEKVEELDFLF